MSGFLSAILGRVIAALVAVLAGWLFSKWGITIDDETQRQAVEWLLGVVLIVYGIVHKLIDAKLNPSDAAAPDVIESDKRSIHQRRMTRSL